MNLEKYFDTPETIKTMGYAGDALPADKLFFGPISTINIFVGENNSGKSRFMRGLFELSGEIHFMRNVQEIYLANEEILKGLPESFSFFKKPNDQFITNHRNILTERLTRLVQNEEYSSEDLLKVNEFYETILRNPPILISWPRFRPSNHDNSKRDKDGWTTIPNSADLLPSRLESLKKILATTLFFQEIHTRLPDQSSIEYIFLGQILPAGLNIKEMKDTINSISQWKIAVKDSTDHKKTYIPTLRSLHNLKTPFLNKKDDGIFGTTIDDAYNIAGKSLIFTGQQFFDAVVRARNNKSSVQRRKFEEFESFISETFFSNETFEIIADPSEFLQLNHLDSNTNLDKVVQVHMENGGEFPIHDLGDGIQALIILLYPIFMAEKGEMFFIEEPELNLHPGMQRIFLETVSKLATEKDLTIFFTTHSNHLLDLSVTENNPISIFKFKKLNNDLENPTFDVSFATSKDDHSLLHELGVHQSSVFLANCSIWVEGITDRQYIRLFLDLYLEAHPDIERYHEDLHYVFFEYGGANLPHFNFDPDHDSESISAFRLNTKIILIADKDKKDEKHIYYQKLSKNHKFKDNFIYYTYQKAYEIDDTLPKEWVAKAATKVWRRNLKLPEAEVIEKLEKVKSGRIYQNIKKFLTDPKKGNGLPSDKKKKLAIEITTLRREEKENDGGISWDQLKGTEAGELAKEVYNFIKAANAVASSK